MFFIRKRGSDLRPMADRIRLSVLEPPCRCREPMLDPDLKGRREIALDVRGMDFHSERAAVLQAMDGLENDACLRVTASAMPWPLLSTLQATGERYQILERGDDRVEFMVWRFLTPDQSRRYLNGRMECLHSSPDPELMSSANSFSRPTAL
jgi:uncharacterized protein (DUF2249 family)